MAKGIKKKSTLAADQPPVSRLGVPSLESKEALDSHLALLFSSSSGPVKAPERARYNAAPATRPTLDAVSSIDADANEQSSEGSSDITEDDPASKSDTELEERSALSAVSTPTPPARPKRKRSAENEDLEDRYMRRVAQEEVKDRETIQRHEKRRRHHSDLSRTDRDVSSSTSADDSDTGQMDVSQHELGSLPQHETLEKPEGEIDLEKSARTVFLSNVSTATITSKSAKRTLLNYLSSFLPSLSSSDDKPHKLESIRFRSTAFSSTLLPKRAAFATKELMDSTTKSTNAYVVYSTSVAVREAVKRLNGTLVLERHLRVDSVAHPAVTDPRRCVFVGNLGFVDDDTAMKAADGDEKKGKKDSNKTKQPSDVEEGLWREFGKVGTVENVRVPRDPQTRIGKGFAYVQFQNANAVEAALLYNDKKFPPLLPRKLRVTRARAMKRKITSSGSYASGIVKSRSAQKGAYNPKQSSKSQSLNGRANKLLGHADAAKLRAMGGLAADAGRTARGGPKADQSVVFEGYRASSKEGTRDSKLGKSGRRKGKPTTRSSRRGTAWKAAGGAKAKQ
ncbi:MAG: Nucleolar protein 12 [Piccolia ochrophora]|nr:MAG: Nucleolar protein 12 [Piccolia ochrophora]